MAITKPISDLATRTDEIARICQDSGEPVIVTRQGEAELVVLSHAVWEQQQARLELYQALDDAEADVAAGDEGVDADVFFSEFSL
jgi:PHD/YefM family antitoxin component YafN of YafNO toxin-antitoxin module